MRLQLPHKKNMGLHIKGMGKQLDIIIKEIIEQEGNKRLNLTIKGLDGFDSLDLTSGSHVSLLKGLSVGVDRWHVYCDYSKNYKVYGPREYKTRR